MPAKCGCMRLVLGDQLSVSLSALSDIDPDNDTVLMVEAREEATHVRHHKQKIVLVLSAMRHFALTLQRRGIEVDYVRLEDRANTNSLTGEIERAVQRHRPARLVMTEPSEWRVQQIAQDWRDSFSVPLEIRADDRFLCSRTEFAEWADGRKSPRMEHFYRHMRRKTGWLMNGSQPEGERWNYDRENRKPLPGGVAVVPPLSFSPDEITVEVIALTERHFSDHFGDLQPFGWATTREQALQVLDYFVNRMLARFGDYQDAMKSDESRLFHSALSPYLNIGLLGPAEVCLAALESYRRGEAPLQSVEAFIRQILGWREYVRGIYWLKMPGYADSNFLDAGRPLPSFYWNGDTDLNCLRQAIDSTRRNAYAHHIQRLMLTGNFALLSGINPVEVEQWYLIVYADAFDWVELPNTHGMALYADGGLLGSKPYAASGAYINRMSDYCAGCRFNPAHKLGPTACPFNYLYWNFLIRNKAQLQSNPRLSMSYRTLEAMNDERRKRIASEAEAFLSGLD